jgi:hypothetical protein
MKRHIIYFCILLLLITTSFSSAAGGRGGQQMTAPMGTVECLIDQLPIGVLSVEDELNLLHMVEEEKVARDVYSALYGTWGHWTFDHIATSEQRHMDAVASLMERYQVELPMEFEVVATFDSDSMQDLFDALVNRGSISLVDALQVGATIEDLDIYDLQEYLALTDNEDIQTVYQNLLRGSRNHLRSFVYQLSLNGEEYVAQYLTQAEVDAIVATERERGLATANGANMDNGDRGSRGQRQSSQDCLLD